MAPQEGRIHAFMVTFDRVDATVRVITALLAQSRPPDTLLVVNNGSAEDGAAIAMAHPSIRVIDSGDNIGPAGGWSLAVRSLLEIADDDDWLMVADDDIPPPEHDTIERLLAFAIAQVAGDPRVAGVGTVGARYDARTGSILRISDAELAEAIDHTIDVDTIGGGHWPLLHVAALRSVEPPDAALFFGFEELEYFLKVRAAGFRLVVDADGWRTLRTRHQRVGLTTGSLRSTHEPAWRSYYSTRNQIHLARRFGTTRATMHTVLLGMTRALRALGRPQARAARAHALGVFDGIIGRLGRRWPPGS